MPHSKTGTAILFIVLSMTVTTLMDALSKWLSGYYSPVQIAWSRYLGQLVIVAILLRGQVVPMLRTSHLGSHVVRSIFQVGSTVCMFIAFGKIALAEGTAIATLNPVFITVGAAIFLGERFGPRRFVGVIVALIGALIIIRPGMGGLSIWALLPLGSAICYTGYSLMTRKLGAAEPFWTSLLYAAIIGSIVLSILTYFVWTPVAPQHLLPFMVIGAFGAAGQLFVIRAFSLAEASVISPFTYVSLIFAVTWGYLFFGDVPDLFTGVGALVIVGAGLYVWHRETQTAKDLKLAHDRQQPET